MRPLLARFPLVVGSCVVLASCATHSSSGQPTTTPAAAATPAATVAPHETPEQAVARLLSPESTAPLTPQTIQVDSDLRIVGHGTGAATVQREGEQIGVVLPIGGTEPVRCVVINESIDLANALRRVYERVRHENADMEIRDVGAGFVGDTPYLDAQALYVVGPANQRLLGHLKMRVFNVGERGFVCLHDEAGYIASFDRATRPMMELAPGSPRPVRYILSVDGHACGWMTTFTVADGTERVETTLTSFVMARSAQELLASDHANVERCNRAGEVSDARMVDSDNGTESNYHVRRTGVTRRYHVDGRHLDRDIAGDFTAATPIVGSVPAMQRAWRALTGPRPPATVEVAGYESDHPLVTTTQIFRMDRVIDARRAWLIQRSGEEESRLLVGAEGVPDEMSFGVADHALTFRRVTE